MITLKNSRKAIITIDNGNCTLTTNDGTTRHGVVPQGVWPALAKALIHRRYTTYGDYIDLDNVIAINISTSDTNRLYWISNRTTIEIFEIDDANAFRLLDEAINAIRKQMKNSDASVSDIVAMLEAVKNG